jgi:hypothetical protein
MTDDTDQHTRQQILKDTYLSRAQADADLGAQGRFKRETTTEVTSIPIYPQQPASSPWAFPPEPASDQLGYEIDAMEPVGTPAEVQASKIVGVNSPLGADDLGGLELRMTLLARQTLSPARPNVMRVMVRLTKMECETNEAVHLQSQIQSLRGGRTRPKRN